MVEPLDEAADVLRDALSGSDDPIRVSLTISRTAASNLLRLLEAERSAGAVVVAVKEFYTTTEAATLLGISRATLMKLIDAGEIEAVKVGTHHRVAADELLAFKREREVSRRRAAEALTEFSARSAGFRSNVHFHVEDRRPRRDPGEGQDASEQ